MERERREEVFFVGARQAQGTGMHLRRLNRVAVPVPDPLILACSDVKRIQILTNGWLRRSRSSPNDSGLIDDDARLLSFLIEH